MKKIFTFLSFLIVTLFTKGYSQTTLGAGDVAVIGYNTGGAPDNFQILILKDLTAGTVFFINDNEIAAASSTAFTDLNEVEASFTVKAGQTILAGTVISLPWGAAAVSTATYDYSSTSAAGLGNNNDEIFIYTAPALNSTTFTTLIYFVGIGTSSTPIHNSLALGTTAIKPTGAASRYKTTGATYTGTQAVLLAAIGNTAANWEARLTSDVNVATDWTFSVIAPAFPTVNLSVSSNAGSETGPTAITVTATASSAVTGDQTVSLGVSGTGITAGDYTLSGTTITILNGQTIGTATFTVFDDAAVEGPETATLTISGPSAGITLGSTTTQNIAITDNDVATNAVNLSVSTNTATEAGTTLVTVTATADVAVTGNQTVSLVVTGTGISLSDYILSGTTTNTTTITILNGQTTGSVTFRVRNDAETEGAETAILTISSPSIGITLGTTLTQNVSITDNVCQELMRKSTATSAVGAEISAFDPVSKRVYTVAGTAMEYYDLNNTGVLSGATNMPFGFTSAGNTILPNSVAVKNGIVAVAYAIVTPVTFAQQQGVVAFYNASSATYINHVTVGFLPDMLTFTPDGTKVLTANEGEPNSYGQGTSFDPEGSVSIIDISGGVASATVVNAGFTSFNGQAAALRTAGVRIYGPGATVAQDLEPEYIAFSADGTKAFVTLQENNAIAELDIATATITQILPLGLKNHNIAGNGLDASDQDGGTINIQNWPVRGMYQPDAMASVTIGGTTYFITANEGDSRAYTGYSEEIRVSAAGYVLDPTVFPNAATLKLNANLGRLQLSNATGDTDNDGDFDELHALGARSFSIWNSSFSQVFDSGDQLEQITATQNPRGFNSDGTVPSFDSRSDNKGPEPEAVTTGVVNGVTYAFIGSERTGDILVYDISNPASPVFKQYIDHPADLQVEGLLFVPANESPTGKALVIASAEISRTVTVYEFSLITNALATVNTNVTFTQDATTNYGTCTDLIAKVAQIVPTPINGTVTAKVWIEPSVINYLSTPLVQRHYEITPTNNASTATGRVTLYFTQAEFTNFNNDPLSVLDLPADAANSNGGIANLRIVKYSGVGDATGLPGSYVQSPTIINPADTDIFWNATESRWEVSFDVNGFSAFFVGTDVLILPLKLKNFTGTKQIGYNQLNWEAFNNNNIQYFELESSENGVNFSKLATINTIGNTNNKYKYNDNTNAAITYYKLKIIERNGVATYSNIIKLSNNASISFVVYPNPVKNVITLQNNNASLLGTNAILTDIKGAILQNIKISNSYEQLDMSNFKNGIYLLKLINGQTIKIIKD